MPVAGWDVKTVLAAIIKELDMAGMGSDFAKTIYIGGGSPSCLGIENVLWLVRQLSKRNFCIDEFTVEVNPGQADGAMLAALKNAGVNRLSIGVQSFDASQLQLLGRNYNPSIISDTVLAARSAGFTNISMDLIFAIPGQSLQSWSETLKKTIALGPEHISAYSLSYEEDTKFEQMKKSGQLEAASEELDRQMYYHAINMLAGAGYGHYEISNFAKPAFECVHNLIYWTAEEFLGIGPAAASFIGRVRRTNVADVKLYLDAIEAGKSAAVEDHSLDDIEFACQVAVLGLRRIEGIRLGDYKAATGFDFKKLFAYAVVSNAEKGLLIVGNDSIRLSRDALAIADSVLCDFADL